MASIGLAWPISAELFQTCTVSWRDGWWLDNVRPMSRMLGSLQAVGQDDGLSDENVISTPGSLPPGG